MMSVQPASRTLRTENVPLSSPIPHMHGWAKPIVMEPLQEGVDTTAHRHDIYPRHTRCHSLHYFYLNLTTTLGDDCYDFSRFTDEETEHKEAQVSEQGTARGQSDTEPTLKRHTHILSSLLWMDGCLRGCIKAFN